MLGIKLSIIPTLVAYPDTQDLLFLFTEIYSKKWRFLSSWYFLIYCVLAKSYTGDQGFISFLTLSLV